MANGTAAFFRPPQKLETFWIFHQFKSINYELIISCPVQIRQEFCKTVSFEHATSRVIKSNNRSNVLGFANHTYAVNCTSQLISFIWNSYSSKTGLYLKNVHNRWHFRIHNNFNSYVKCTWHFLSILLFSQYTRSYLYDYHPSSVTIYRFSLGEKILKNVFDESDLNELSNVTFMTFLTVKVWRESKAPSIIKKLRKRAKYE